MKRSKKISYEGEPFPRWKIEKSDGLTSRDFYKDARDFELKEVSFLDFTGDGSLRLYSSGMNTIICDLPFPFGTIFVVKEVQL